MCVLPYFVQKCSCPLNNADVCLRLCPNEPEPYVTAVVKTRRLDSARPKMLFKMLYRKGLQNLPDHFIVSICQQCPLPYCSPVMPLAVRASLIFQVIGVAKLYVLSPGVQIFSNFCAFGLGFGDSRVSGSPDLSLSAGMETGLRDAKITFPSFPFS